MALIEVLVLEGASPSSVAITFELLDTANQLRRLAGRPAPFQTRLAGPSAQATRCFLGRPEGHDAVGAAQVLVVPGMALAPPDRQMWDLDAAASEFARRKIRAAYAQGAELASSGAGVFLLASAGVLDGRRATTSWWLASSLARLFPAVLLDTSAMVVRDGRTTTAGAPMAQLDLMLSIVARHGDLDLAERCARHLLLEERSSQSRYMAASYLTSFDERIGRAERWARERLNETLSVGALADAAGLTTRTFARRLERVAGLSPIRFLQRVRVERAVELLETTRLPFDEIARRVGYAEPSTLRRLLRRHGSAGAREIRVAFQPSAATG